MFLKAGTFPDENSPAGIHYPYPAFPAAGQEGVKEFPRAETSYPHKVVVIASG
jgi:hypothetical protein